MSPMSLLSVIIPNKNSPFLTKTIEDLLNKAEEDVEILVNVDGDRPETLVDDPRVHYHFPETPVGMRAGINKMVELAKGDFIMKTDDHCMFGQGYDRILKDAHAENNWIQIPRRYALDPINWRIELREDDKYPIDYMYFDFPRKGKPNDDGMHGVPWKEMREKRKEFNIDDTPSMQGSCWFMRTDWFLDFLGGMDHKNYGGFAQESQELGFRAWLSGGAVKVNKLTWYAHLHKGKTYGRMYKMPPGNAGVDSWSASHWLNNEEPNMIHKFEWLIDEKFPGMPTWPEDWKQQVKDMGWIH